MTLFARSLLPAALAATLAGCASLSPPPQTFDLSAPAGVGGSARVQRSQILDPEPTTTGTLDSERIVVMPAPLTVEYLGQSQWSDRLPRLVQLRL
ncbi:MAG: ABC transporter, partial [Sphingomonas taxi]